MSLFRPMKELFTDPDRRRAALISLALHLAVLLLILASWLQRPVEPIEQFIVIEVGTPAFSELTGVREFDEYNPEHLRLAEQRQEEFLYEVKAFQDALPEGRMVILMGNHDFNAVTSQGPLRTDDVTHLEWKEGAALPQDLFDWISSWPYELVESGMLDPHVTKVAHHGWLFAWPTCGAYLLVLFDPSR